MQGAAGRTLFELPDCVRPLYGMMVYAYYRSIPAIQTFFGLQTLRGRLAIEFVPKPTDPFK
jgi:hypothetical protein